MIRQALISGARSRAQLEAYLPRNYKILRQVARQNNNDPVVFVIEGEDSAGWTLDDYVLPRLASGLIFGKEIVE
jgi:hypothetical protein